MGVRAETTIFTERADFEKVGPGSTSYVSKPVFTASKFRRSESLAVTLEVDEHEVTIWLAPESFQEAEVMFTEAAQFCKAAREDREVSSA